MTQYRVVTKDDAERRERNERTETKLHACNTTGGKIGLLCMHCDVSVFYLG